MPSFYGTIEDVNKHLMPRIRNRVQTLTKPYKSLENGVCQHCGRKNGTLEAAHVHGRDRKTIVRGVLERYRSGNGYNIGDLDAFEEEIMQAHEPVEETFVFLCRDCHRSCDAEGSQRASVNAAFELDSDAGSADPLPRTRTMVVSSTGESLADDFYDFLIGVKRCKEYTPSGRKSTAYSYQNAVDKVRRWEDCSWDDLPCVIDMLVEDYSRTGAKADLGKKSNNTIFNALAAFREFCEYGQIRNPRSFAIVGGGRQ